MTAPKKEKTAEEKAKHVEAQRRYREKKKAAASIPAPVTEAGNVTECVEQEVVEQQIEVLVEEPAAEVETVTEAVTGIRFSIGTHTYDNCPVQHEEPDFDALREKALAIVSPSKGLAFLCAPFGTGMHDDPVKWPGENHWRLGKLVLDRTFISFDCDGFGYEEESEDEFEYEQPTPAECFRQFVRRLSAFKGFGHTTSSSTPEEPRMRVTLALGKPISRAKGVALGKALESILAPDGDVLFDPVVYRGEQPCYLPVQAIDGDGKPVGATLQTFHFDGAVIDPDAILPDWVEPTEPEAREVLEISPADMARADSALMAIPNTYARPEWFKLLAAAKEAGVSKEIAEMWSAKFDYQNDRKARKADREFPYQWQSITVGKAGGVGADYLFSEARKFGWIDPALEEMFSEIPVPPADVLQQEVRKLAELAFNNPLDYDMKRKAEAKRLGLSLGALDKAVEKLVKAVRKGEGSAAGEGAAAGGIVFAPVEPWEMPVDGAELLQEIIDLLGKHIVCDQSTKVAVAFWVLHTWFIDVVDVSPIGSIQAPEKECGKTTLLEFISRLVFRPLPSSNISPAALYRVVEACSPTLLIDEVDSFLKDNEDMRGIINSGHTRTSAVVIRTVGDDHEPKQFSTWGAKLLCGIGKIPETLASRAIIFHLRRKTKDEKVARLRRKTGGFDDLKRKIARFTMDNMQAIKGAEPVLPEELGDRAQDNWEPLLAIADLAGEEWAKKARKTACIISGVEPASAKAELLKDIREVFDALLGDKPGENPDSGKVSTNVLLFRLCMDKEKAWATYNRGREMTSKQLATRLKEYDIHSKDIKFKDGSVLKGYTVDQFSDAWSRYLSTPAATENQEENG